MLRQPTVCENRFYSMNWRGGGTTSSTTNQGVPGSVASVSSGGGWRTNRRQESVGVNRQIPHHQTWLIKRNCCGRGVSPWLNWSGCNHMLRYPNISVEPSDSPWCTDIKPFGQACCFPLHIGSVPG